MGANLRHIRLTVLQALALAAFALIPNASHAQDITTDLVGHWTLDDASGTTITDSAGANTGTWSENGADDVTDNSGAGQIDDALTFSDANNTFISIANESNFDFEITDSFTIAGWVNRTDTSELNTIFSKIPDTFGPTIKGYSLAITENGHGSCANCLALLMADGFTAMLTSYSGTIGAADGWTHVAATYDGSNTIGGINLYIDGALVAADSTTDVGTITTILNNENPTISKYSNDFPGFDGAMDDVRVYSRELTAPDVAALYAYSGGGGGGGGGPVTCDAANEAVMWYNADESVMQYCNGSDWISMGESTGSVAAPAPSAGLIGHWTMDDTVNTTAVDSAAGGNDGTMMGGLDAGTDSVPGQVGTAILMNGSSDYINVGDQSIFDFGTSDFSIGMWLKFDNTTTFTGYEEIISKGELASTDSYYIAKEESGGCRSLDFGLDDGGGLSSFNSPGCTFPWTDTDWHHIIITFDRDADATLYIDGVVNTTEDISVDSGYISNSMDLLIGAVDLGGITSELDGAIDDVRIYNRALTPAEVTDLYNAGASVVSTACTSPTGVAGEIDYNFSAGQMQYCNGSDWIAMGPATATGGSENFTYTEPTANLIGHWALDETTATTTAVNSANPGTYDGTMTGGLQGTDTTSGQIGTALTFNGTSDYIETADIDFATGGFSYTAWFKTSSATNQRMWSKHSAGNNQIWGIVDSTGVVGCGLYDGTTWPDPDTTALGTNFADGTWHHLACVADSSNLSLYVDGIYIDQASHDNTFPTNNNAWRIGARNDGAEYFNGDIDDARIYDVALTPEDVYALYRTTGGTDTSLVGHWKLDDTNTTALDSAGSNDASMGGGLDGTNDSVAGVYDTALYFDGIDDRVESIYDPFLTNSEWTIVAWFNSSATPSGDHTIIGSQTNVLGGEHQIYYSSACDCVRVKLGDNDSGGLTWSTTPGSLFDGEWHQVVVAGRHRDTLNIYIDGQLSNSTDISSSPQVTQGINPPPYAIGSFYGNSTYQNFFEGAIDDVRIYSRMLTSDEITQLYLAAGTTEITADCSGLGDAQATNPETKNCYYRVDTPADWATAKSNCEANGDHLAVISTAEEQAFLDATWFTGSNNNYWLGGSDAASEGVWIFHGGPDDGQQFWSGGVGGSPVNGYHTKWETATYGQPDNGGGAEHCLELHDVSVDFNAEWNDEPCANPNAYVCERSSPQPYCTNPPGAAGEMVYNDAFNVMQYCNGSEWVSTGTAQ